MRSVLRLTALLAMLWLGTHALHWPLFAGSRPTMGSLPGVGLLEPQDAEPAMIEGDGLVSGQPSSSRLGTGDEHGCCRTEQLVPQPRPLPLPALVAQVVAVATAKDGPPARNPAVPPPLHGRRLRAMLRVYLR